MKRSTVEALVLLAVLCAMFGVLGWRMGGENLINTLTNTAHNLLLNTVFYLMGITVLTGALSKLLAEFGVVRLLEKLLRPLMKPLYNLPGAAALGGVMTFLSDNPAIIALSKDKTFSSYFKKYQLVFRCDMRFGHFHPPDAAQLPEGLPGNGGACVPRRSPGASRSRG